MQQVRERNPDIPLLSVALQLFPRDREAFQGQNAFREFWVFPGASSQLDVPGKSSKGGNQEAF